MFVGCSQNCCWRQRSHLLMTRAAPAQALGGSDLSIHRHFQITWGREWFGVRRLQARDLRRADEGHLRPPGVQRDGGADEGTRQVLRVRKPVAVHVHPLREGHVPLRRLNLHHCRRGDAAERHLQQRRWHRSALRAGAVCRL